MIFVSGWGRLTRNGGSAQLEAKEIGMRFFEDVSGRFYPIANIREIGPMREEELRPGRMQSYHSVWLAGMDDPVKVGVHTMELVKNTPASLVPAQPGTFIITAFADGDHMRTPVVLWGLGEFGTPIPYTITGAWDGTEQANQFVLHPDGHCSAFEHSWENLETAITEVKAWDTSSIGPEVTPNPDPSPTTE